MSLCSDKETITSKEIDLERPPPPPYNSDLYVLILTLLLLTVWPVINDA